MALPRGVVQPERGRENMNSPPELSEAVMNCISASGLVDHVEDVGALQPVLRQLEEDERLCLIGEPGDCLWVVLRGEIAVKREGTTIVHRRAGSLVGEQALLLQHGRRSADLLASGGPAAVLRVSKAAIDSHRQTATIWKNLAAILSSKLQQATAQRHDLHCELRETRLAYRAQVGNQAVSAARLYPQSLGPEYRKARCIVWFSDVVGFSRYTAAMPPERAAQLVQEFLTPQIEAIEKAGGFVDKFIGDGVMAFWVVDGVPSDPCFASLTAAEHAVAGVGDVWIGNERLKVRIGLHLGEVSAGFFGTVTRRQYTIIGSEVNKAARLEQAKAEGLGFIRTSEEFFAALPEAIGSTHLPKRVTVDAKNIDGLVVRSSKGE